MKKATAEEIEARRQQIFAEERKRLKSGKTILVVDDDIIIRKLLESIRIVAEEIRKEEAILK